MLLALLAYAGTQTETDPTHCTGSAQLAEAESECLGVESRGERMSTVGEAMAGLETEKERERWLREVTRNGKALLFTPTELQQVSLTHTHTHTHTYTRTHAHTRTYTLAHSHSLTRCARACV